MRERRRREQCIEKEQISTWITSPQIGQSTTICMRGECFYQIMGLSFLVWIAIAMLKSTYIYTYYMYNNIETHKYTAMFTRLNVLDMVHHRAKWITSLKLDETMTNVKKQLTVSMANMSSYWMRLPFRFLRQANVVFINPKWNESETQSSIYGLPMNRAKISTALHFIMHFVSLCPI